MGKLDSERLQDILPQENYHSKLSLLSTKVSKLRFVDSKSTSLKYNTAALRQFRKQRGTLGNTKQGKVHIDLPGEALE